MSSYLNCLTLPRNLPRRLWGHGFRLIITEIVVRFYLSSLFFLRPPEKDVDPKLSSIVNFTSGEIWRKCMVTLPRDRYFPRPTPLLLHQPRALVFGVLNIGSVKNT